MKLFPGCVLLAVLACAACQSNVRPVEVKGMVYPPDIAAAILWGAMDDGGTVMFVEADGIKTPQYWGQVFAHAIQLPPGPHALKLKYFRILDNFSSVAHGEVPVELEPGGTYVMKYAPGVNAVRLYIEKLPEGQTCSYIHSGDHGLIGIAPKYQLECR
ncbi:hypothetical protein D0B54_18050 [Solimonas sp. K1W22B-7]|uniref:hypothetical protein n=1 Tax=Solimonas sp. K1W22B-7 TaxID=2303331 RepID=UPI000E32E6C5|nr:hypothetical protein [Solimonas sp. K1W22B-7]AXQ30463.1 hypothetical protein D0B54_18050 [Solimonas sp. K1W22B-7]